MSSSSREMMVAVGARGSQSGVNLASHVGHTISATGVVSNTTAQNLNEDAKDAANDTGMK